MPDQKLSSCVVALEETQHNWTSTENQGTREATESDQSQMRESASHTPERRKVSLLYPSTEYLELIPTKKKL